MRISNPSAPNIGPFANLALGPTVLTGIAVGLLANTSAQTIDTYAFATFASCEYVVQVQQSGVYQVANVTVTSDGTVAHVQVFGLDSTSGLTIANFSAAVVGGTVSLFVTLVSGAAAGTAKFSAVRINA